MKRSLHFLLTSSLLLWSVLAHGQQNTHSRITAPRVALATSFGRTPLYFIENRGQIAGPARYYLQGRDRTLFAADDGLTFVLEPGAKPSKPASTRLAKSTRDAFALRLEFVGANPNVSVRGEGTGPVVNLFTGGRENWRSGLPSYSRLVYADLWPGIDLALIGDTQRVKYEFRVKPGADPKQIRFRYRGGQSVRLEPSGDLSVDTPLGTLSDERPVSFQELDGRRAEVKTQYALRTKDNEVSFAVARYDLTKPLVIDPAVFVYASYLGGAGTDRGSAIAVDHLGAAYIFGDTTSPETSFPTGAGVGSLPGADTTYNGGLDTFVAKVLPSGAGLEYVTYVGGSGDDIASGMAVDSAGCVYAAGYTNSGSQFPVIGGPGTTYNGGAHDVFVFKLNATGTALIYSGFIGGAGDDREPAIAVDDSGGAYVTGLTYSNQSTFPTGSGFGSLPGADQTHNGDSDAFVVKVKPDGTGLQYASYIGGSGFDNGYAIGVDGAGNVYIGGNTASHEDTFPNGNGVGAIPGPNTTYAGGPFDAFVVKLNATGTSFSYVAFVGGSAEDRYVPGLAVDRQGNAWIAGHTVSAEDTFPTGHGFGSIPGFDKTYNGSGDAFVVKIDASGTAFDYATYIGGSGDDEAQAISVDSAGNAYVTGRTNSTEATFPNGHGFGSIPGPDTTYNGGPHDIFVAKLNPSGTDLVYATYIGGAGGGTYDELGAGITADGNGNAYVTGYTTSSTGFPGGSGFGSLPGFDQTYSGNTDAFVIKISSGASTPPVTVDAGADQNVQVGATVTLAGSGSCGSGSPQFQWQFVGKPPGSTASLASAGTSFPSLVPDAAGIYTAELTVSCGAVSGTDRVQINARSCSAGRLAIYPRSAQKSPGSQTILTASGGSGHFIWNLPLPLPGASLSANGTSATYIAGDSSGEDTVELRDDCGSPVVTATLKILQSKPPEVTSLDMPGLTQGQTPIQVLAQFSEPVEAAEICIDKGPSPPEGSCLSMELAPPGDLAGYDISCQPRDPSGLSLGRHSLAVRGRKGTVWGPLKRTDEFEVNEHLAVLLLNGYSFFASPSANSLACGNHPDQWWQFSPAIACRIRDFLKSSDSNCLPTGTDCRPESTAPDYVCAVDNLDGQEGLEDVPPPCTGRSPNGACIGNVSRLESYIKARPWLDDADEFILIGHSYGGQIARAYAQRQLELQDEGKTFRRIKSIITLDTPHLGAELALLKQVVELSGSTTCNGGDRALPYFLEGADSFNSIASPDKLRGTSIWAISTERQVPNDTAIILCALIPSSCPPSIAEDDEIVSLKSQRFTGLWKNVIRPDPVKQKSLDTLSDYSGEGNVIHNLILEKAERWSATFTAIKAALMASTQPGANVARTPRERTSLSTDTVLLRPSVGVNQIGSWQGVVTNQVPVVTTFSVDTGQDLAVDLLTSHADPSPTLEGPDGELVRADTADGLLNRFVEAASPEGLHQTFLIHRPSAGLWTLRFTVSDQGGGPHLPATGASWYVQASIRSVISLSFNLSELSYLPGDSILLKATLNQGNLALTGATILAQITPDGGGNPTVLTLYDDGTHGDSTAGDGTYAATVVVGDWTGAETVVTAEGTSPLGQFQRQTSTHISVFPTQATIHDLFIESAPDTDGNGRYDSLTWTFPVQVAAAGNYSVVADLVASDDTIISHASRSVTAAAAGDISADLVFPGQDIYRSGRSGPYSLTNALVFFAASDGERLVARGTQLATSGGPYWSWLDFEREASPSLTWVFPVVEQVTSSNSVSLQWQAQDGNGATTLDLYYDTSGNGFNGTAIVTGLDAVNGGMRYSWDLSGLPDGTYYVYARIRNGDYSNAVYGGRIVRLIDTDGDGMPDSWETAHGLNPNDAGDTYLDPDHDGLANVDEYLNGCDPHNADSDGGGEMDGSEVANGRDGSSAADDVTTMTFLGVSPSEGDSRGGEQLLILGSGIQPGAAVDFGGTPAASVTFVNNTRLLVQTPAHAVGITDVTVSNPSGGGSVTKVAAFMFLCQFVESPQAANSGPLCPGQTLQLTATGLAGAAFRWTGPNGFSSTLQNPTIPNAGAAASGAYTVTETVGQCVVQATTTASIGPAAPLASSNNPVCAGKDLQLTASAIAGATYQWTGPNNYQSTQQNPVIPSVTPASSGAYSVAATVGGCSSAPASIQISVRTPAVSTPQGGETWYKGQTYNIQWSGSGSACDSTVKIEAYKGGAFYGTITSSTADSGSYSWTIPASYGIGSDYKIRITGTTTPNYTGQSNNNFIVVDPPTCLFSLTAPNGGETWYKGHSYNIGWSSSGSACNTNVKLEAYKGGTFYATISSSTGNNSSYSWTVPTSYADGNDYKVKITDAGTASFTSQSSNPFIVGTPLNPIFKNGFESGDVSAWSSSASFQASALQTFRPIEPNCGFSCGDSDCGGARHGDSCLDDLGRPGVCTAHPGGCSDEARKSPCTCDPVPHS